MFEHITETQWAYFAGIVDGEGCICIHAQKRVRLTRVHVYHTLFLSVGNTSYSLLKWLYDNFGGSITVHKKLENRKQVWHWNTASRRAEEMLRGCLRYLVIKKDQADLALLFRDSYVGLKPCSAHPLPKEIVERREDLAIRLSQLKNAPVARGA